MRICAWGDEDLGIHILSLITHNIQICGGNGNFLFPRTVKGVGNLD